MEHDNAHQLPPSLSLFAGVVEGMEANLCDRVVVHEGHTTDQVCILFQYTVLRIPRSLGEEVRTLVTVCLPWEDFASDAGQRIYEQAKQTARRVRERIAGHGRNMPA